MMVRMVPTWLPPELVVSQPYSMGPVLHWSPPMPYGFTAPVHGTVKNMDDDITTGGKHPSAQWFLIRGAFIAPRGLQQDPKREITMIRPKGLLEALGLVGIETDPAVVAIGPAVQKAREAIDELEAKRAAERAFADALAALEDDDE